MSAGAILGPVCGGVLYAKLGYKAPFVFALILVFFDFALRVIVIEKHTALRWIREGGVVIPGFEAPGYVPSTAPSSAETLEDKATGSLTRASITPSSSAITLSEENEENEGADKRYKLPSQRNIPWKALGRLFISPRPAVLLAATFLDGLALAGILGESDQTESSKLGCEC